MYKKSIFYEKFSQVKKIINKQILNKILRTLFFLCIIFIFYKIYENYNFIKLQLIKNKYEAIILLFLFVSYQILLSFKNFFLLGNYTKINFNFAKWQEVFFTSILYNIVISFTGTIYRAKKIKDVGVSYFKYASMLYFNYYIYIIFTLFVFQILLIIFYNSFKDINYLVFFFLAFFLILYFIPNAIVNFINKKKIIIKIFFFKRIFNFINLIKKILKNKSLIFFSIFFNFFIFLFEILIFYLICKIFYNDLITLDFILLYISKFVLDVLFITGTLFSFNEILFAILSYNLGFNFDISLFIRITHSVYVMISSVINLFISKIILMKNNSYKNLRIKENNLNNNILTIKNMKNRKTLLTVIIPYYNTKNIEITKAINSILIQKNINFKILILVVDDCSEEPIELNKLKLKNINKKIFKIKIFRKIKNEGDTKARLTGINLSKSKYVAFLDSDDFWHPQKLFNQMNFLLKTKAKVVGCDWNNNTHFWSYFYLNKEYYKLSQILLAIKWWPHISTILLERNFFYQSKANKISSLRFAGDGDLLLKLAANENLYILKKNLVTCHYFKKKYYSHGLSASLKKMNIGETIVLKNNFKYRFIKYTLIMWIKFKYMIRYIKAQ